MITPAMASCTVRLLPMRSSSRPPRKAPGMAKTVRMMPKMPRSPCPAEGRRGIDAAESDDGGKAVVVEHEGDQIGQHVAVAAELRTVSPATGRPASRASEQRQAPRPAAVGREQEHRDHEDRQPQRRGRTDQALEPCRSAGRGRTAAGRRPPDRTSTAGSRSAREQRDQAAAIAQAPAEAAQPAHALGPHDVGQLRVVEHDRHLRADRRQDDRPADRRHESGRFG